MEFLLVSAGGNCIFSFCIFVMFAEITVIITHFVFLQMISDLSWQEPIYVKKKTGN